MLLNQLVESARRLSGRQRSLRRRAHAWRQRPTLVVIPPILGTRLRDLGGRPLWGYTRCLFFGKPAKGLVPVHLDGLLDEFPIVPGLYGRDIYGGLVRFLVSVGGYRLGEDLTVLSYDFRLGVAAGAAALERHIAELQSRGQQRIDLLCPSSGGLVARYYLAYGGRDVLADPSPRPHGDSDHSVRRVVYVGTPQRGTLVALDALQNGFRMVPGIGRHYGAAELADCQISYDLLPHPDDGVLADAHGRDLPCDLYDVATWRQHGWPVVPDVDLADHLRRARQLHRALDLGPPHPDFYVIGAVHRATRRRLLLQDGVARVSCSCASEAADGVQLGPGDGSISEESLLGVAGVAPRRVRHVAPREHHDLSCSDPETHDLVLEALLAPEEQRAVP